MRALVTSRRPSALRAREEAASPRWYVEDLRAECIAAIRARDAAENSISLSQALIDTIILKMQARKITYSDAVEELQSIRRGPLK